jgi:hypothetical protein
MISFFKLKNTFGVKSTHLGWCMERRRRRENSYRNNWKTMKKKKRKRV